MTTDSLAIAVVVADAIWAFLVRHAMNRLTKDKLVTSISLIDLPIENVNKRNNLKLNSHSKTRI